MTSPDDLGKELRSEAQRAGLSATEIARDAIRQFLYKRRRQMLHDEITAYARKVAGSQSDLDEELEHSAIDDRVSRKT